MLPALTIIIRKRSKPVGLTHTYMPLYLLLIPIAILLGFTTLTFLSNENFIFVERIAYGTLIGFVCSAFIGFIEASYLGFNKWTVITTFSILLFLTLLVTISAYLRKRELLSVKNILDSEVLLSILILICVFFVPFYLLFGRVIILKEGGIYTGLAYNLGDLPYHWSVINSFLYGGNFPPEHSIFSGQPLRYYFLSDFFTALLIESGLSVWSAFTWQGMILSAVLLAVIYLFTYRFSGNKLAAAISPFLFFFNGGLGFLQFFKHLPSNGDQLINTIKSISDYTNIEDLGYRWINTTTSLLVPQRPFLFGFPMAILVLTMLWQGIKKHNRGYFAVAGLVAGALPLFHAHSSLTLGMISVILFCLFPSRRWLWFFVPAGLLTLPQAYYLMPKGETAGHFFTIHFGWVANGDNIFWFYLKNTGLVIPIFLGTLIFSKSISSSQRKFAIPFIIIFLIANVIQFTPWDWDNIKVLIFFYIGSIPFVAYGLASLWNSRLKFLSILLFISLILSGITSVVSGTQRLYLENDKEEMELAETIKQLTEPKSIFLTAPSYNHFILLTGRRILQGFVGSLWAQGVNFNNRLRDLRRMYRGSYGTRNLLAHYGIDYVVIGPPEEREKLEPNLEFYKDNFPILVKSKHYYVFKIKDSL
jgi:hypothetical protein